MFYRNATLRAGGPLSVALLAVSVVDQSKLVGGYGLTPARRYDRAVVSAVWDRAVCDPDLGCGVTRAFGTDAKDPSIGPRIL